MRTSTNPLPRLGIDVSKLTFDACLSTPEGSTHSAAFDNNSKGFTEFDRWLNKHGASHTIAGLEATGPYGVLLLWHLHGQGHIAHQLNARRVKDYARSQGRRVKTDRADAAVIAAYLKASEGLIPWQPPVRALIDLQALIRRRDQVMTALNAERSRKDTCSSEAVTASLKRQIDELKAEVARLDKAIDKQVLENTALQKSVRLLRSIDGIGRMVAATILAEVPAISAFSRARDVAAFVGLTPSLAQSGSSIRRRGRMTKEGSSLLRKMLYMAALQAVKRPNNAFHKCYKAFVDRGKPKMCALVAIMHKIIRIAFGVLKHDTPFVENFAKLPHQKLT